MPTCKSGDGCQAEAVMGVPAGWPLRWCEKHGEQLERIAREYRSRKRTTKAVKPKPPERRRFEKLPLEVRMKRICDHVASADGPVTREAAAKAAGLCTPDGSLVRIVKRAVELGLLETRRGADGGLVPGPNSPVPG